MPRARPGPEQLARAAIDTQLEEAGWEVQDREDAVVTAAPGVDEPAAVLLERIRAERDAADNAAAPGPRRRKVGRRRERG